MKKNAAKAMGWKKKRKVTKNQKLPKEVKPPRAGKEYNVQTLILSHRSSPPQADRLVVGRSNQTIEPTNQTQRAYTLLEKRDPTRKKGNRQGKQYHCLVGAG